MNKTLLGLLAIVPTLGACTTLSAPDDRPEGASGDRVRNVALRFGERQLEDSDGLPGIDDQPVFGVELDAYRPDALVGWEVGLHHFEGLDRPAAGTKFESGTTELSLGLRKTFALDRFRLAPYFGAGLSAFYTERDFHIPGLGEETEDDFDTGLYFRVGINWYFHEAFFLGVDYRRVAEEWSDYGGFDLDADQLTLALGVKF